MNLCECDPLVFHQSFMPLGTQAPKEPGNPEKGEDVMGCQAHVNSFCHPENGAIH